MKKLFLALAFLGLVISASAQKSLLYEVSGNGLTQPSYLYGTVHIICKADYTVGDSLKAKLLRVDELVMEIDMSNMADMLKIMSSSKMPGDTTLDMLLPKKKYKFVEGYLRDSFEIAESNYKTYKPMLLTQFMVQKMMGCNITTVEIELMMLAMRNKVDLGGLETVDEQMAVLDGVSLVEQAEQLYEQLQDMDETTKQLNELVTAYINRDLDALNKVISESDDLSAEMNDALLASRNLKWIPIIESKITEKQCLFAFGAGHLGGEQGVINLLIQAGYTVNKIEE